MAVQNAGELSYFPCLSELLALPVFQGSLVLTGEAGLEAPVTGVNLSDTPEYYNWLSTGELMVTTCYAIHDDPEALAGFIPTLVERGMSGLCIKPVQYLGTIPQVMVDKAREHAFPLVLLPDGVRFADIIKAVSDELLRRQTALLSSILTINKMLTRTIVEGADLDEIAGMARSLTGSSILILDCINGRRSLRLTESAAARFCGMGDDEVCAAIISGAKMYVLEVGGYSFGFLYIYDPAHLLAKWDEGILTQVLQTIPLEISRERTVRENSDRFLDDFVLHLLSDNILDEERECARAMGLGMDLSENCLIIRAQLQERPDASNKYAGLFQRTLLASEIKSTLANLGISMRKIHTGGEYLIILSSAMDQRSFSGVCERFPEAVEKLNREYTALCITAGCGRPHEGIAGLRQSDHEARVAFRAARRSTGLLLFSKLGLLRVLYASEPEEESAVFVYETLGKLLEREQSKGQELLKTLESYFRNFGNLRRVSEEMFTHYNTVVYRIKSIQEATGLDLHDADQRFLLELALYLHRYERRES
ncbi:MAG TPA: PucR family transcriptional regulator ligand-binding domain-containing protein [Pseudoflavonifractor sp.]|nr:PucR family transcriptional regulator ligand-binding domain-containing protein [Pseudoflavonifractor sp.]